MDPSPAPVVVSPVALPDLPTPEASGDGASAAPSGAVPSGDGVALCANCDAPRVGAFCPGCGQRQTMDRLTLKGLWRDFASRVFNLNRGLLGTVVEMSRHPGQVPMDYAEGRRRRYANPLTYLFLASALSVFTFGFSEDVMVEQMRERLAQEESARSAERADTPEADLAAATGVPHDHDGDGVPDHEADETAERFKANLDAFMADGGAVMMERVIETMTRYQSLFMLLLCLPFALLCRLLFGPKRNLAEISVFSLYVVAHIIFVLSFVTPVLVRLGPTVSTLGMAAYVGLAAWAAVRFWDEGWSAAARAGVAMTLSLAVYMGSVSVVSLVVAFGSVLAESGASWGWLLGRILG